MSEVPIITIDGLSGTGKGTVCRHLVEWLQWHFLDSGALYRAIALLARKKNINLNDEKKLVELAQALNIKFKLGTVGGPVVVELDNQLVTDEIRTETCGNAASTLASIASVRHALLDKQRTFYQPPGLIADGRDMATVVFPQATLKIFLTATIAERAKRRYEQLQEAGIDVNMDDLFASINERDERDVNRSVSPSKPAKDAIIIDTSMLSVSEVVSQLKKLVSNKILQV